MESRVEDVVIVGAGVAGLATSLGLHRYSGHYDLFGAFFFLKKSTHVLAKKKKRKKKSTNVCVREDEKEIEYFIFLKKYFSCRNI